MKSIIGTCLAAAIITGCSSGISDDGIETSSQASVAEQLNLPAEPLDYEGLNTIAMNLDSGVLGSTVSLTGGASITNEGATLGRVLFYEKQLSIDGTVACASCHRQNNGFADSKPFSDGVNGGITSRNAMSVANVRFYRSGRMFWDERASSLEDQALQPIQNSAEMGLTLEEAVARIDALPYYDTLFEQAFGDANVTTERVATAIAEFERSIVTANLAFAQGGPGGRGGNGGVGGPGGRGGNGGVGGPGSRGGNGGVGGPGGRGGNGGVGGPGGRGGNGGVGGPGGRGGNGGVGGVGGPGGTNPPTIALSPVQQRGRQLFFSNRTQCSSCHSGPAFVGDIPRNNGLDLTTESDQGAGNGRFKMPSLLNIELTAPYMHDGRFQSLEDVVEFYNTGIQAHPNLDRRLRRRGGQPVRMNLSPDDVNALVAFMKTLTSESLAVDERFSDPFVN